MPHRFSVVLAGAAVALIGWSVGAMDGAEAAPLTPPAGGIAPTCAR